MHISVIASGGDVKCEWIDGKNVVVIDVLRATSVMVTALANGAERIIPVELVEEAHTYYKDNESENILLCGERGARIIEGFHFGNSPLSYTKENVARKTMVHTTSNGTRTIKACDRSKRMFIASFLNAQAIVNQLIHEDTDAVIVCSGTNNQYSMDDALCAGMIISLLEEKIEISSTDLGWTVKELYDNKKENLYLFLEKYCYHFKVLQENGFGEDLDYCLQKNVYDIVPIYSGGEVRLLKEDQNGA
jgi:2-phosphosulfolactate phosphatase